VPSTTDKTSLPGKPPGATTSAARSRALDRAQAEAKAKAEARKNPKRRSRTRPRRNLTPDKTWHTIDPAKLAQAAAVLEGIAKARRSGGLSAADRAQLERVARQVTSWRVRARRWGGVPKGQVTKLRGLAAQVRRERDNLRKANAPTPAARPAGTPRPRPRAAVAPPAALRERAERALAEAVRTAEAMRCRTGVFRTMPHMLGRADEPVLEGVLAHGNSWGSPGHRMAREPARADRPRAPRLVLDELRAVRAEVAALARRGEHPWLQQTVPALDRARRRIERLRASPNFHTSEFRAHVRLAPPYARAVRVRARQQRPRERYATGLDAALAGVEETRRMLRVVLGRVREAGDRAAEFGYPAAEVAEWQALVPRLRQEARLLRLLRDNSGRGENPADRAWAWPTVYAYLRAHERAAADARERAELGRRLLAALERARDEQAASERVGDFLRRVLSDERWMLYRTLTERAAAEGITTLELLRELKRLEQLGAVAERRIGTLRQYSLAAQPSTST
jgi:hypothetical protein